jgi:hypothetical protein
MRCPHCGTDFHENWESGLFLREERVPVYGQVRGETVNWRYATTRCSKCRDVTIKIGVLTETQVEWVKSRVVYPISANRGPVSGEVPPTIAADYVEACNVLPISAKASAALSRRCLQSILHTAGYRGRDLNAEIDLLLNEPDPKKAIPLRLRSTIDAISKTALQIIEVEPEEAEWCLEILEECFEHFYVGPSIARAKKDALDQKLGAAGKQPSKG